MCIRDSLWAAQLVRLISWPTEIAGVCPDCDPFFINGEQATLAINNRATATKGIAAFGLGLASARLQLFTCH